MAARGLLSRLVAYRPREGVSPRENFLTEAVAYALEQAPAAARALVERVSGLALDPTAPVRVETQRRYAHPTDGRPVQPDMVVHVGSDPATTVLFEHKWDSPANPRQLEDYLSVAGSAGAAVAFVGARFLDRQVASGVLGERSALLWEDVFSVIEGAAADEPAADELLHFLREQGLAPQEPLSMGELEAYAYGAAVPQKCERLARPLAEGVWPGVPPDLRRSFFDDPPKRYRLGVKFNLFPDWDIPFLFLGLLLDARYYGLPFAAGGAGPDVVLMLDAHARELDLARWPPLLTHAAALGGVPGLEVHAGADVPRRYGALAVQTPLADVLRGRATDAEQAAAIRGTLESWVQALRCDRLVEALRQHYVGIRQGRKGN